MFRELDILAIFVVFSVTPGKCLDNPQTDCNHFFPLLSQSITHYCYITVCNINNAVEYGKLNERK
jgi:hypothetical protein